MQFGFWVLVLASGMLLCGCGNDSAQAVAAKADGAYASGDYSKALNLYEKVEEIDGASATTHLNLGFSALGAQDYEYARQCAEKAERSAMTALESELAQELLGLVAEARKDVPMAAKYYRGLRMATDMEVRLRARSRLAQIYTDAEKVDAAFALLLSANVEHAADAMTVYNLGKLCSLSSMQLRAAALDYFMQAERLLPKGSEQLKTAKDMVSRLDANLKRLQQLPPSAGDAKRCNEELKKVQSERKAKRWKSAEQHAAKAMTADPSNVAAALVYAELCTRNNNTKAAKKAYDAALVIQPNNVDIRKRAATLALNTKRYDDAVVLLRPALVAQPTDTNLIYSMALALTGQKKYVEARAWGDYLLDVNPKLDAAYHKWVKSLPEE